MAHTVNTIQGQLNLWPAADANEELGAFTGSCALEDESFPFEVISDVAEAESWRKEINRPLYHIHKWWAQRLGTVFRAIVIGTFSPSGTDVLDAFYRPLSIKGFTVFDPFMGSGTTIGEAVKLGVRAIGRDINPVAHFIVRNALTYHDRKAVFDTFREIEHDVADEIRGYYKTTLPDGTIADVLYYFWVKQINCPACGKAVDLFSSRIFAKHAYPQRHPNAMASCPSCGVINAVRYDAKEAICSGCASAFNPQSGPARGHKAVCPHCHHGFAIAKAVRLTNKPPAHRLYAKLVLTPGGQKIYFEATDEDKRAFVLAERDLKGRSSAYPIVAIKPGYNTNQALGYNYQFWHEMFNARQLLCLSILADRIRKLPDPTLRDLFTCLFSGILEFNNIFASFKGEGTGAVRHMFAHHVLKPERLPLEANVWGTPKSSGSFMTMFKGRLCRALNYADDPFELYVQNSPAKKTVSKVFGLSQSLGFDIADDYATFKDGNCIYLSCGDSSKTDIDDEAIDAIITDPPFFDNVHYSQLADFFYVWQKHILCDEGAQLADTTRSCEEVQHSDGKAFAERLSGVWSECYRVLSMSGVLAFTYHHSRPEGWYFVLHALMKAGFVISAVFPIKAEMSVAMPKHQAKEPINLDIVLVCRKQSALARDRHCTGNLWHVVRLKAADQARRFHERGRKLSRNDVLIIVMAQLIHQLSRSCSLDSALSILAAAGSDIENAVKDIHVDDGEQCLENSS